MAPPSVRHRMSTHGFAVALVGIALIGASSSRSAAAGQAPPANGSPTSTQAPAQAAMNLVELPTIPTTQGADQQLATVTFDPRLGLPRWLRAIRDVPLWSGADSRASTTVSLPAGTSYLKPMGPFADTRVQVYFPGDAEHAAALAWVDTAAVVPSDVPAWIAPPMPAQAGVDVASLARAPQRVGDAPAPDTTAYHIAIVDDASGALIYSELPETQVPQASTTKIATTIVALERTSDLSQRIKVTVSASAMVARDGSSTMGIEPGRSVSLDTLFHGMMLPSGNDAAEQVALALAGSREQFIDWMNQEAASLGLKNTHFVNPSGMDAAGHYSSAYDMAMLARYAMHNATFRDLASSTRYAGDGFRMTNLNRLLDLYPGADGVKIGFTDAAQKTIVASAVRDGHRVYISLMYSVDLVGDCTALFNWVWDNFTW